MSKSRIPVGLVVAVAFTVLTSAFLFVALFEPSGGPEESVGSSGGDGAGNPFAGRWPWGASGGGSGGEALEPSHVTIEDGALLVDGEPYPMVRCVSYQPVPVGVSAAYGYRWAHYPENYEGDLPMLQDLGANTVAVNVFSAAVPVELDVFMSDALDAGIRTILVVDGTNGQDASDPEVQRVFLERVNDAVHSYRDHPGLLMWWFGTEVDYKYPNASRVGDWYALLERAAQDAHEVDPNHPIVTANDPATDPAEFVNGSPSVDVYGTNSYLLSKDGFHRYLEGAADQVGRKPLFVTEFGVDAYNSNTTEEDEATQAHVLVDAWRGIEAARDDGAPVLGGCVHEWTDQWWKHLPVDVHDTRAWPVIEFGVLPDEAFSEEWFGLTRNVPGTTGKEPRQAYYALAEAWGGAAARAEGEAQ